MEPLKRRPLLRRCSPSLSKMQGHRPWTTARDFRLLSTILSCTGNVVDRTGVSIQGIRLGIDYRPPWAPHFLLNATSQASSRRRIRELPLKVQGRSLLHSHPTYLCQTNCFVRLHVSFRNTQVRRWLSQYLLVDAKKSLLCMMRQ